MGGQNKAALRRAGQLADGWSGSGQTYEEGVDVLKTIARIRGEAGREGAPFEAIVPFVEEVTPEQVGHLVELGMTGTVSYPFPYTIGAEETLSAKLDYLRRFGDDVISKVNA